MYTGTHESLFVEQTNPHELFEKSASISRMPDDDRMWPQTVLSNLFKQLPFITNFDVSINLDRIEPEAGFAFGNALIRSKKQAMPGGMGSPMVKIPLIISDRQLQPFHVMIVENETFPLTEDRMNQAMSDPSMFAGPQSQPKLQKSLVDELYPPYQQRQGFGRTVGAGAQGINKLAQALDDRAAESLSPKELRTIANLKENEVTDQALRNLTLRDRLRMARNPMLIGTSVGGVLGVARNLGAGGNPLKGGLVGAGMGLATAGGAQVYSELARRSRDRKRRAGLYVDSPLAHEKRAGSLSESGAEFLAGISSRRDLSSMSKQDFGSVLRSKMASQADAPNYRMAESAEQSCATCKYFQKSASGSSNGYCSLFDFSCNEQATCDSWESQDSMEKESSLINMYWRKK